MSIRRTILTSGGLASAIGISLAILSAGTLVVFSAIAARVGLGDLPRDAAVARPSNTTKAPPAAITFPSTEEPSEENERTSPTSTASLLDVVRSAVDASTSTDEIADTVGPDVSIVSTDSGREQVGGLVSDVDLGGRNSVSRPGARSPRSGDEEKDEPGDDDGTDRVAVRKDDDDDDDHGGDDDDDDDDGDTSGARGGSSNDSGHGSGHGSRDDSRHNSGHGSRDDSRHNSGHGSRHGSRDDSRHGSGHGSRHGSRDGDGSAHVHAKAAKAKAHARGHSKGLDLDEPKARNGHDHDSHHGDDDDSDSSHS